MHGRIFGSGHPFRTQKKKGFSTEVQIVVFLRKFCLEVCRVLFGPTKRKSATCMFNVLAHKRRGRPGY